MLTHVLYAFAPLILCVLCHSGPFERAHGTGWQELGALLGAIGVFAGSSLGLARVTHISAFPRIGIAYVLMAVTLYAAFRVLGGHFHPKHCEHAHDHHH